LLGDFGTRAPFYAAAALSFGNFLLGYFVLRETMPADRRRPFTLARANPFGAFAAVSELPGLTRLLWVWFFYHVAVSVYPSVWPYFTSERFGWGPYMIGVSLAAYGTCFALVQGLLVSPAVKHLGNRGAVVAGLGIEAFALGFLTFVKSSVILFASIPFTTLGAVGLPALQAIISRRVPDDAQGELQGVLTSLTSLATIIAPLAMTQIFAIFTRDSAPFYSPGSPFALAMVLMLVSILLFVRTPRRQLPQSDL
jgi:DHA1 family tetracycline resistance protein-like MFS transporter